MFLSKIQCRLKPPFVMGPS